MEYAVYEVFYEGERRKGSFRNMFATQREAETFARGLQGEHKVIELWTREISERSEHSWDTVVFDEEGGFSPTGEIRADT